ncbi:MAG TPA: hypothetical protein PK431_07610 [Chitinophagales bacterium]|nr:hypothetical protein [Chitinophagales bacterium]
MKYFLFTIFCFLLMLSYSSQKTTKTKTIKPTAQKIPKPITQKLPRITFLQLIDSTDKFVLNDQTKFAHVDVPKSKYNLFLSYVKDSAVAEIPLVKSPVYYNFTLSNGTIINGDVFWNDKSSCIVFTTNGKKYVNFFTKDGVQQLKAIFKL